MYREYTVKVLVRFDPDKNPSKDVLRLDKIERQLGELGPVEFGDIELVDTKVLWNEPGDYELKREYNLEPEPKKKACSHCTKNFLASALTAGLCANCLNLERECKGCRTERKLKHFVLADTYSAYRECKFCQSIQKRYAYKIHECSECGQPQWSRQSLTLHLRDTHGHQLHWDTYAKDWRVV